MLGVCRSRHFNAATASIGEVTRVGAVLSENCSSIAGVSRDISLCHYFYTGRGIFPATKCIGTGIPSPDVKLQFYDLNLSPPYSAIGKGDWGSTSRRRPSLVVG